MNNVVVIDDIGEFMLVVDGLQLPMKLLVILVDCGSEIVVEMIDLFLIMGKQTIQLFFNFTVYFFFYFFFKNFNRKKTENTDENFELHF